MHMRHKIPLLTKASEQRLEALVEEFVTRVSKGERPEEVLEDLSRKNKLSMEQIRRIAHAYNTGQVQELLKSTDLTERASAPKLVDAESVVKNIFGPTTKCASAEISPDYLSPPKLPKASPFVSTDFVLQQKATRIFKDAQSRLKKLPPPKSIRQQRSEILHKQASIRSSIINNLFSLRDYFRQENAIDPQEIIENYRIVHKQDIAPIIKQAMEGVTNRKFSRYMPVDWNKTPYKEVVELHKSFLEFEKIAGSEYTKTKTIPPASYCGSVIDQMARYSCLSAKVISDAMEKSAIVDIPTGVKELYVKGTAPEIGDTTEVPVNMEEMARLSKYRVQALLVDLANNDPIISKYTWNEILDKYNSLATIAPIAIQQEPVLRHYLRKMLENDGQLDPIDLETLTKTNQRVASSSARMMQAVLTPAKVDTREPRD